MPAKSKVRSGAAKRRTRTSIVGVKIYPASVEPSERAKRIIEALTPSTAMTVVKGRTLEEVVAGLPKERRARIEKRAEALIAEALSPRKRGGPERR